MTFFTRPKHTLSSVVQWITEGLEDNSIVLEAGQDRASSIRAEDRGPLEEHTNVALRETSRIVITPRERTLRNDAGVWLRSLREQLGLTMRDVETASIRIAEKHGNKEFLVPISRLSDFEIRGVIPSLFRLYALAVIYRRNIHELFSVFGVDLADYSGDLALTNAPKSDTVTGVLASARMRLFSKFAEIDVTRTVDLGGNIEHWGILPLTMLEESKNSHFTYAFIGTEDLTMYPILLPGSFVQVDEARNEVVEGGWRSEYERPIYFVETREGFTCCWCTKGRHELILQSHPLSPVPPRVVKYPQGADVIGQVVAAAIDFRKAEPSSWPKRKEVPELLQ